MFVIPELKLERVSMKEYVCRPIIWPYEISIVIKTMNPGITHNNKEATSCVSITSSFKYKEKNPRLIEELFLSF